MLVLSFFIQPFEGRLSGFVQAPVASYFQVKNFYIRFCGSDPPILALYGIITSCTEGVHGCGNLSLSLSEMMRYEHARG